MNVITSMVTQIQTALDARAEPPVIVRYGRRILDARERADLARWTQERVPTREIAKLLGVSQTGVSELRKAMGIGVRNNGPRHRSREVKL